MRKRKIDNGKMKKITILTIFNILIVLVNIFSIIEWKSLSSFNRSLSSSLDGNNRNEMELRDVSSVTKEAVEEKEIATSKHFQKEAVEKDMRVAGETVDRTKTTVSKLIKMENDNTIKSDDKILSHLYVHIPKAGGYGFYDKLRILMSSRGGIFNGIGSRKDQTGWAYRPCNAGLGKLRDFSSDKFPENVDSVPCNLWMTEDRIARSDHHLHAYTVIRSPAEHVISQYFHCAESSSHADRADKMPGLDEWLDYHVQRLEGVEDVMSVKKDPNPYHCYDPINLQSQFVNFNREKNENHLVKEFDVIGVMDQFSKSICAISIRYTGVVPLVCDCTDESENKNRRLDNANDHGVKHHGASFKPTESQARKIAKLTELDNVLYDKTKLAFAQQVLDIEKDFGVKLCENPTISED